MKVGLELITGHHAEKRKVPIKAPGAAGNEDATIAQFQGQGIAGQDLFRVLSDNQELRQIVENLQSELSVIHSQKIGAENQLKKAMGTIDENERSIESLRTQRYEAMLCTEQIMKENKSYTEKMYSLENENLL